MFCMLCVFLSLSHIANLINRINYGEIEIEKQIGVGGFARVFKGMWRGNEVAVKELMLTSGKLEKDAFLRVFAEFRKEVAIMSYMKHDNIIRVGTAGLCTVYECMEVVWSCVSVVLRVSEWV